MSLKKLRSKKYLLVGICLLLGLVGLTWWLIANSDKNNPFQPEEVTQNAVTIMITDTGFEPATVKIRKGDTVNWVNGSNTARGVAANPYPERTELPELNSNALVEPGVDYTFTFKDAGTYGYHDTNNPNLGGQIIVE